MLRQILNKDAFRNAIVLELVKKERKKGRKKERKRGREKERKKERKRERKKEREKERKKEIIKKDSFTKRGCKGG